MKKLFLLLIVVVLGLTMMSCTDINSIVSMIPGMSHVCADANKDTKCDTCGGYVAPAACKNHIDNNNDGVCDQVGCGAEVDKIMDTVVFKDKKVTYDGKPQTLEVKGAPAGAEIEYDVANTYTNAGEYEITAYITAEGYEDLEVTATLTIKKRSLTIVWPDSVGPFPMSGKVPEIEYTLTGVAAGDEVAINFNFGNCDFTKEGDFEVIATSANPNYQIKTTGGANRATFTVGDVKCTILFNDDTTQGKDPLPQVLDYGDTLIAPVPVKSGYELLGWYDEKDNLWNFDNPVTKDMTLTAKWKLVEYEIIYHTNGGTNPSTNPTTCTVETGIVAEAPTRTGKIFLGWYTNSACTEPLSKNSVGSGSAKAIHLYAKWSTVEYTTLVTGDSLGDSFVLSEYLGDGAFRYTFSANVKEFGEDGVIRIGRGKEIRDGAYVEITSNAIIVYNNIGDEATKEDKFHTLAIDGYIVIDVVVNNGVTVYLSTPSGTTDVSRDFVGKMGEVFVTAENAELERCEFGFNTDGFEESVWILGDSTLSLQDNKGLLRKLKATNYIDFLLMSAYGQDSAAVLDAFGDALEISKPKYAVWSFPTESGEAYDAALAAFIELCEEKEITPILTTDFLSIDQANAAKNAAVIASGERYIDLASLEQYSGLVDENGYFAQFLADFPEIITPTTNIKSVTADILDVNNPKLQIANVKLKDGKVVVFTAKIDGTLDGDELIRIGHGYGGSYSGWLEITRTEVISYKEGSSATPSTHGITIKNYITIIWQQDERLGKKFTIVTDGGSYSGSYNSQPCDGWVAVYAEGGVTLTDAKAHYTGLDYDAPIWAFGDSYFSLNDPGRWPNYLYGDIYDANVMVVGRGGLDSKGGIEQLKDALQYATPKAIVWGYGINDGSDIGNTVDEMNSMTYAGYIEFLSICEEKEIIPVIFSTPALPMNSKGEIPNHQAKINAVLNGEGKFAEYYDDYRIASLPHAVDAYERGATWYPGMMYSDAVHPTALGARNMYMELLCALPEIMIGEDAELMQTEKAAEQLSGSPLTIDTPEFVEKEYGFTFIADFTGDLSGAIEVGNGKDVEGGSWVEITQEKVTFYTRRAGSAVKGKEFNNEIPLNDIIMVRVHVVNGEATISLVSSADSQTYEYEVEENGKMVKKTHDRGALFTVNDAWGYAGDAFALSTDTRLYDAQLSFVYEK